MARKTKAQLVQEAQAFIAAQQSPSEPSAAQASAAAAFFASRQLALPAPSKPEQEPEQALQEPQEPEAQEPGEKPGEPESEPISDEDIAAQQAAAEKAFDEAIEAAMAAAESAAPSRAKKIHIARSSIVRPTKKVWAIADAMLAQAAANGQPRPSRAEIIAECIRRGIASGTSATQYQAWKRSNGY